MMAALGKRKVNDLRGCARFSHLEHVARRSLAANDRERDRAEHRRDGDRSDGAHSAAVEPQLVPAGGWLRQPEPAEMAVRLALVVQPGDRLLAHVAALREAHGALVESGLLGDGVGVEVEAEARAPGLDAQAFGGAV